MFFALYKYSASASAQQEQISYVETSGSWCHVYDTNGKKITTLANQSVGELVGWSAEITVASSSWYSQGKTLNTMSEQTIGTVLSVAGNTFTSRSGSWIYTWDKTAGIKLVKS